VAVPDASVRQVRVLIADDEPALRVSLSELLSGEAGIVLVGAAGDADEAIELAVSHRPHVALVDVKMPAGGGARAAREIARLAPDTRVIALSAFEDRATVLEMLRAGAVGYLVKGGATDQIVDSIARAARGGASLSPEVVDGVVKELAEQLRRDEVARDRRATRRAEIMRFVEDDDIAIVHQPIVDLRTRAVVGLEALARFPGSPERPPDQWFAEATELGLGRQLELAAIRAALVTLPRVPESAFLALNCSHRTVTSPELRAALAGTAARVVLEITEHEPIDDYDGLVASLVELRAEGVRVAIDDAGAGFASLRHALVLEPDFVKVDLSLTSGIDRDRRKRALTASLVSFAEAMGMVIVAEGIETHGELDTLRELGVPLGQGNLVAAPTALG
jgi:EAL domain-containing protein (putative c-di-GMP-specific phosphodiesterase class I)/CheY-like chemotaxis protein